MVLPGGVGGTCDLNWSQHQTTAISCAIYGVNRRLAKYELSERLGEGRFGATYRAKDTVTGVSVALKVLKDERLGIEQFRSEVKALMSLRHPNIIRYEDCNYFEVESGRRLYYLAMEFADGGTLRNKVGRISTATAVEYSIQLLRGLAECHRHAADRPEGRLHCDLKPDNVFLSSGTVKIGDFGISADSTRTADGQMRGTPA